MNSREKGKRGELSLAKELAKYGYDCRRGQQFCGANGDADVVGLDGVHIECKTTDQGHGKLYEWIAQAKADTKGGVPIVFHKRISQRHRGNKFLVTMELEDFMEIYEKWRTI